MSHYVRNYVPGGTFFFTVVTYRRRRFLTTELARTKLRSAMDAVRKEHDFTVVAMVLLPDHLHAVWQLPPMVTNYSLRWSRIKEEFTKSYLGAGGRELLQSKSRRRQRYRGVWHKRFWEHTVRDETDLQRCVDYIHYNPCKHKLVARVRDWPWSTFHRFVQEGEYDWNWGQADPCPDYHTPEWHEAQ
jgi:putative transposase